MPTPEAIEIAETMLEKYTQGMIAEEIQQIRRIAALYLENAEAIALDLDKVFYPDLSQNEKNKRIKLIITSALAFTLDMIENHPLSKR